MAWLNRNRRKAKQKEPNKNSDYLAVKIKPGTGACDSVKAIKDTMFLGSEAPFIPLVECENRHACRCCYRHYSDRRQDRRRETDMGLPPKMYDNDRRSLGDRRKHSHHF